MSWRLLLLLLLSSPAFAGDALDLLQARCLECHNAAKAKGGLDLSTRDALLKGGDSGPSIAPGQSQASLLYQRLTHQQTPGMPYKRPRLPDSEISLIARWIDAAAPYPHPLTPPTQLPGANAPMWSLQPLAHVAPPAVKNDHWRKNPIDRFILATLESRGLSPAPQATRRTLIRRVYYDLLGLPPSPEQTQAFENDPSPDAWEKLIDHLLSSPQYGERWARHWLDVVHYADTHGYDKDKRRPNAWPYRDYVIRSFNADKPYARFVREQVAGDVLFPGDADAMVATGFLAAGPWDFVGHVELGEDSTDGQIARTLDRDDMISNAVGVLCSVTIGCARCHDHKFDPIPSSDYYALQAIFAGVTRGDRAFEPSPQIAAQRQKLLSQRQLLLKKREQLEKAVSDSLPPQALAIDREIRSLRQQRVLLSTPTSPTNGYHSNIEPRPDVSKWVQIDLGHPEPLDEVRLHPARPVDFPDTPGFGFPRRFNVEISLDGSGWTTIADHTRADFPNPKAAAVSIPLHAPARYIRITATLLWERTSDYVFALGELEAFSKGDNMALGATVTSLDSIQSGRWARQNLVDGFDSRARVASIAGLNQRALTAQIEALQRQRSSLIDPVLRQSLAGTTHDIQQAEAKLAALPAPQQFYGPIPRAPVPIHILRRGEVTSPGKAVGPGALSALPCTFPPADFTNEGQRRASLAMWLTDPANVLVQRSIVNRIWQYHFGRGIVDTPNDFGHQGNPPSHPELLDFLASYFNENGQSIKKLHRLILTSAAYQQSSIADNPRALAIDADDHLLWKFPRQKLEVEEIRDSILQLSGKLDLRIGGAGFDLFAFKDDHSPHYDYAAFNKAAHPESWRRTIYRFTVRSVPDPFMEALDCADPNISTPVRANTNTALQALAMLNEPFVVEQSHYLAQRLASSNPDLPAQVDAACQNILSRLPTTDQRPLLLEYARKHRLANLCRILLNTNEFLYVD